MHLTDNQTKVRDALPTDGTATPAAVAETSGLAYSTVTRLLRELADIGAAVKDPEGWRHANPTSATRAADEATTTSIPAAPTIDATDPDHPDPAGTDSAAIDEPDETDAEVDHGEPADVGDIEPDDMTHTDKAGDPTAEAAPAENPTPGHAPDDGPVDDPAEATVTVTAAGDASDEEDAPAVPPAPPHPRLSKGQLRDRVLIALRAATEPLGATQLSKVLDGKSPGAISNACDRLVERGDAVLVNEAPRRFQATRTTN